MMTRIKQLHAQFYSHIIQTSQIDPIRTMWHRSTFMQHIDSHLYHSLVPYGRPHPSKKELKELLLQFCISQHSTHLLCSYIRLSHSKYDPLFREPSKDTQLAAIRWRRNAFRPMEYTCPVEGGYLSRSHINHLLTPFVEPLLSRKLEESWTREKEDYPELKYTLLDILLNDQLYNIFMDCVYVAFNVGE